MTPKERAAMQRALEVLKGLKTASSIMNDGPDDSDVNHAEYIAAEAWSKASEAITALREALAEQEKPLYRKVLREMLDAHEQAEQEPMYISKGCVERGCACHYSVEVDGEPVAVYSAPVRTKDLTDDEIRKLWSDAELDITWFARAVIAKFKEKNK